MDYTILTSDYTPNSRQLEILMDEYGNTSFALHISKGTIIDGNKLLPGFNHPLAEVIYADDLYAILLIDAERGEDLNDYDRYYGITLYTMNEYNRKLNGYTPIVLNK